MAKKKVNTTKKAGLPEKKQQQVIISDSALKAPADIGLSNQKWFFAFALFLIGFLLYTNTIQNGYVLDDTAAIKDNKFVQKGISGIPDIMKVDFWYFFNQNVGYYRPLSLITFAIEIQFFGNNPHVSHFDNALLFALTGFLLFLLLMRLFPTKNPWYAFLIGLVFVAHPIHTEVVANIKSRDEILSFLNMVAMLFFALKYKQEQKRWELILSMVFFYLALLSKETAVVGIALLPLVLYFRGDNIKPFFKKILPYAGVAAFFFLQKYYFLSQQPGVMPEDQLSYPYISGAVKLPTAFYLFAFGLKQLVFPWPLSFDYSFNQIPAVHWTDMGAIAGILLFISLAAMAIKGLQKRTEWGLGLSILFITIAPMMAFVVLRGGIMAERILYAPSLAFSMIVVYLLSLTAKKLKEKNTLLWLKNNLTLVVPVVLISIVYGFETAGRNKDWKDEITLYSHDVKYTENSARAHYSYGNTIMEAVRGKKNTQGKKDTLAIAKQELEKAFEIYDHYVEAISALGTLAQEEGDYKAANDYFNKITKNANVPGDAKTSFNKANALLGVNDFRGAIAELKYAVSINPKMASAYINMATAYESLNLYDSAIDVLKKAVSITPDMPEAYINLGSCYSSTNKPREAIMNFNKALQLRPGYPEAYFGIGQAYMNINIDSAFKYTTKGLALNPDYLLGQFNMGLLYVTKKDYKNADQYFQKALQLKPDYVEACRNLAYCATQLKDYDGSIAFNKRALTINPNIPEVYYSMAYDYIKLGNKPLAEECKKKGDELKAGAH